MEKVRWRGTWGIGDSMHALNVCHKYARDTKQKINLEMHWSHDEDYLEHPKDPETIVQRTDWIHKQYHRQEDVTMTHVFNSDLFPKGNMNPEKDKTRFIFDSGKGEPVDNNWVFKPEAFDTKRTKKIVIWTPMKNSQAPRNWKNFLTKEDWHDIIKMLSWEGWNIVQLTYRTPIRDAFRQIQQARFIVCYDGMWHYIARNLGKPMFIPSYESITNYNTPNAIRIPKFSHRKLELNTEKYQELSDLKNKARGDVMDWWKKDGDDFSNQLGDMNKRAEKHLKNIKRFHED